MSIYKRGEVWYYYVKVGNRIERKSAKTRDKAKAKEVEALARARMIQQTESTKTPPKFADFAMIPEGVEPHEHILRDTYYEGHALQHKRSHRRDKAVLKNKLIPYFGHLRMDEITLGDVNRYIAVKGHLLLRS